MSSHSLNWLLNRVNTDIRNFYDQEFQVREEALAQQDAMRSEIKHLEERCVHAEQELQNRNSRLIEMETDLDRKFRQFQDRVSQLEAAAQEDAKTIVDMRDNERLLRSEVEQFVQKLRMAEDQALQDERTINELRELMGLLQQENENLVHQHAVTEERAAIAEAKLRRALDEVGDEVGRLRGEVERQRRDVELGPMPRDLPVTSPQRYTSAYSPSRSTSSPISPRTASAARQPREVSVQIHTTPFSDLSLRLDSLHQKLKSQLR